jgi:hypothetical protein
MGGIDVGSLFGMPQRCLEQTSIVGAFPCNPAWVGCSGPLVGQVTHPPLSKIVHIFCSVSTVHSTTKMSDGWPARLTYHPSSCRVGSFKNSMMLDARCSMLDARQPNSGMAFCVSLVSLAHGNSKDVYVCRTIFGWEDFTSSDLTNRCTPVHEKWSCVTV